MINLSVTLGLGGTTTTPTTSTPAPQAPQTPDTPVTPGVTPTGASKSSWNMAVGETVYINTREGSPGPLAWVAYTVAYVFADGNAAVVRDPGFVAYTGSLSVGCNLRRKGERYADTYPGP